MTIETQITLFSTLLFCIGLALVLVRRDMIRMLAGIELMLNAANIQLVFVSRATGEADGSGLVLFIILVSVCEAAVGLAIFLRAYRYFNTSNTDQLETKHR